MARRNTVFKNSDAHSSYVANVMTHNPLQLDLQGNCAAFRTKLDKKELEKDNLPALEAVRKLHLQYWAKVAEELKDFKGFALTS